MGIHLLTMQIFLSDDIVIAFISEPPLGSTVRCTLRSDSNDSNAARISAQLAGTIRCIPNVSDWMLQIGCLTANTEATERRGGCRLVEPSARRARVVLNNACVERRAIL